MRAKQTTEGGDGEWCVLAPGGLWSSNSNMHLRSGHKRSGLHKHKEDKQEEKYTTLPISFYHGQSETTQHEVFWLLLSCNKIWMISCLDELWSDCLTIKKLVHLSSECICLPTTESAKRKKKKTCPTAFFNFHGTPPARVNITNGFLGKLQ